jgi:hypothetical protein
VKRRTYATVQIKNLTLDRKYFPSGDCSSYAAVIDEAFRVRKIGAHRWWMLDGHHRVKYALSVGRKTVNVWWEE